VVFLDFRAEPKEHSVRLVSIDEEAANYMRNETENLIVLEMKMSPGMDGLET
jgi:CheY-like chemotaxis protein